MMKNGTGIFIIIIVVILLRLAAAKLAEEGYTNIIDCGGIIDWTGEIEK